MRFFNFFKLSLLYITKKFSLDDIKNENSKEHNKNGHLFQITHTEFWIFIASDDMIADIMKNKKYQAIIKEMFIRCRKLNISLVFITQAYFSAPEDVRSNSTDMTMKINNKRELQNIAINHSADIDYKDFVKIL